MKNNIDDKFLRRISLPTCNRCANRDIRGDQYTNGFCTNNPSQLDGLPIRCVGEWANDKIYYLAQYFGIFATGMKNKWRGNLRYLEICSGPGRCSTRDNYEQDGTALAVINHPAFEYLQEAVFIDYDSKAVDILNQRIKMLGHSDKAKAFYGDYNDSHTICQRLKENGLTLCLIDPTDCSVPFKIIEDILVSTNGKCDFIVSVFDKLDFNRNAVNVVVNKSFGALRKKYERFLGDETFFMRCDIKEAAARNDCNFLTSEFNNKYESQLKSIGLVHQDTKKIDNFYHLLFASKNKLGLEFWKKSHKYDRNGQSELF